MFQQHRRPKPGLQEPQLTTDEYTIRHQRKAWRGIDGMQNGQRSRAGWVEILRVSAAYFLTLPDSGYKLRTEGL